MGSKAEKKFTVLVCKQRVIVCGGNGIIANMKMSLALLLSSDDSINVVGTE